MTGGWRLTIKKCSYVFNILPIFMALTIALGVFYSSTNSIVQGESSTAMNNTENDKYGETRSMEIRVNVQYIESHIGGRTSGFRSIYEINLPNPEYSFRMKMIDPVVMELVLVDDEWFISTGEPGEFSSVGPVSDNELSNLRLIETPIIRQGVSILTESLTDLLIDPLSFSAGKAIEFNEVAVQPYSIKIRGWDSTRRFITNIHPWFVAAATNPFGTDEIFGVEHANDEFSIETWIGVDNGFPYMLVLSFTDQGRDATIFTETLKHAHSFLITKP